MCTVLYLVQQWRCNNIIKLQIDNILDLTVFWTVDITLAVKLSHTVIPTVIYRPKYRHCHLVIIAGLYSIVYRKVTVGQGQ